MSTWSKFLSSSPAQQWMDYTMEKLRNLPLSAALGLGLVSLGVLTWVVRRDKRKLPPGPIGLPLVGAMHKLSGKMTEDVDKMRQQYGDIISFHVLSDLWVFVCGYPAIKEAFVKQGEDFAGRPTFGMDDIFQFTDQLFMSDYNDKWKQNKKFAVVTLRKFGFGTPQLEGQILTEYGKVSEVISNKGRSSFDPVPVLRLGMARIIFYIIFGEVEQETDEDIEAFCDLVFKFTREANLGKGAFFFPVWLTKLWYKKNIADINVTINSCKSFVNKRLEQHKLMYDPDNPRDVMDMYLTRLGEDMSEDDIVSNLLVLLPDAFDTLSYLVCRILLHIAYHPEVQRTVHEELDRVVGKTGPATLAHKNSLPYMQATILECLRFHDIVPLAVPHKCRMDTKLYGYDIPKGAIMIPNLHSIHQDPEVFPNPSSFDPEHFLKDGELANADHCVPFSLGRRMCPGEMLAKLEMFLFVSNLMLDYQFSFQEDKPKPSIEPVKNMFEYPKAFELCAQPRH